MGNEIIEWEDQYGAVNAVCVSAIEQMKLSKNKKEPGGAIYIMLHNDSVMRTFADYELAREFYDECCAKIRQMGR